MASVIEGKPGVQLVVSGARGRQGPASGALGAGSVGPDEVSDDSLEQAAIAEKLGLYPVLTVDTTKTFGTGGDFASLEDAMLWARLRYLADDVVLTLKARPGASAADGLRLWHPNSERIFIEGDGMNSSLPDTYPDLVDVEATDIATVKAAFKSWINVTSTAGRNYGIHVSGTWGGIANIAIFTTDADNVRYCLQFGEFGSSSQNAFGRASCAVGNVAVFGGSVWSVYNTGGYVTQTGPVLLGGCRADGSTPAGAPLGLRLGAVWRADIPPNPGASIEGTPLFLFAPGCRYGLYNEEATALVDGCLTIDGATASGRRVSAAVFCRGGKVAARAAALGAGEYALMAERCADVALDGATVSNFDPSASSAVFELDPSDTSTTLRAIFAIGLSGSVSLRNVANTGGIGNHLLYQGPGATVIYAGGSDTGGNYATSLMTAAGIGGNLDLDGFERASSSGSDDVLARRGARIDAGNTTGTIAFDPALNSTPVSTTGFAAIFDQAP